MTRTTRMLRMLMAGSVLCGALVLTGGARLSSIQGPQTPEAVLGAAIHQEEAEGNLEAAIESYQTFLARHGDNRSLAVQALLRMGQAYETLGRPEARDAYERVLRDYADHAEQVSAARARLAALDQPRSPADPSTMVVRRVWESHSGDYFGGPSPDGRYLTYIDFDTGNLAVHDVVTGQQRPLTQQPRGSSGRAGYSALSPDGQQVAYGWEEKGHGELRLIGLDTRGPRVLYQNEEVTWVHPSAWTPDGKHILALFRRKDETNQLVLVSVADGSVRVLKSLGWNYPRHMGLSPDGRYIVYDSRLDENSPNRDIFLLATDGSREIPLIEHPADDTGPLWTPDGTKVVFASDRTGSTSAWVLRLADGKAQGPPELVKPDLGRFFPVGFDRKGSYYYELHTGMRDVYLATLNPVTGKLGAAPSRATQRFVGATYGADWSPDGQSLAYVRRGQREALLELGSTVIIQSLDTGTERELSPTLFGLLGVRWFPDGRSLLTGGRDPKGRMGIYRAISEFPKGRKYLISLSFRGKASVRPAQVGGFDVNIVIHGSTAVRGRGDLVAYRWALWKLTAPWTHRTRPPHLGKRCAFSTSSTGPFPSNHSRKTPKGPKIALGNPDRPIYRIDAHTGETTALVQSQSFVVPIGLSPDGEEIFYGLPGEKGRLVVRNLESGQTKDLYSSRGLAGAALSPDGRWLALSVFIEAPEKQATTTGDRSRADGYHELKIMPAAGGEPRELHRLSDSKIPINGLGWTPDGRHVLFVRTQAAPGAERDRSTELWQIPVEGGELQSLGLAMEGLRGVRFHPDGQRIAFTSARFKVEVWALENFLPDLEVNK